MMASFKTRRWPYGFVDGKSAVILSSEKPYSNRLAAACNEAHITISIADYSNRPAGSAAFIWRALNVKAKTLPEAKALATRFFEENPERLIPSTNGIGVVK